MSAGAPYLLAQPEMASWETYVAFEQRFSADECRDLIALAQQAGTQVAQVGAGAVRPLRRSRVHFLQWHPEVQWVFERLAQVAQEARRWYPFHLCALVEGVQLTHYASTEAGHYDWHRDMGSGAASGRKLSLALQLSDPGSFEGGALEMASLPGDDKTVTHMAQGSVMAFPAWEMHRVCPVTSGERWSLVAWVSGPPFC